MTEHGCQREEAFLQFVCELRGVWCVQQYWKYLILPEFNFPSFRSRLTVSVVTGDIRVYSFEWPVSEKLRTCHQEVEGEITGGQSLRFVCFQFGRTEAEALVLRSRVVKQHFFKFNTMVPTSLVSGSDCQKTEVFKESQVILVQCKKKAKCV